MSGGSELPSMRVEHALRLLPDVDALGPLRACLLSASRGGVEAERYRTVGKRTFQPADIRALLPDAARRVQVHIAAIYRAALGAIEAEQRGDSARAVRALLSAGELEEGAGRGTQAIAWYEHALRIAEGLRDRRPEISALQRLGRLQFERDELDRASRSYQRSLAIAEADADDEGAARACLGLGTVAEAQARWSGAQAWFRRGLRYETVSEPLVARLHLGMGEAARARGQLEDASSQASRARELFERAADGPGIVRAEAALAQLDVTREQRHEALTRFRAALARLRAQGGDAKLEIAIRMHICQLYVDWGRLPDAEDEIRSAEETAVLHNASLELARLYLVLGKIRGVLRDDTGFVFFEKSLELTRHPEPAPRLEAEVYLEYGLFRRGQEDFEEARAYLERAREILACGVGDGPLLGRIETELARLPRTDPPEERPADVSQQSGAPPSDAAPSR